MAQDSTDTIHRRFRARLHSFAIVAAIGGVSTAWAEPNITNLGIGASGLAVDADGSAVAGTVLIGTVNRAFRWTLDQGLQLIEGLQGATGGSGFAISADGSTVVGIGGGPFRWTAETGTQPLGYLAGDDLSYPRGINGDGSVVVGRSSGSGHPFRAWTWVQGQGLSDWSANIPGDSSKEAECISPSGITVSGVTTTSNGTHVFLWTGGGTARDIGSLIAGGSAYVKAMSSDGTALAGHANSQLFCCNRAFRWTEAGGWQNLGQLPGTASSSADGISAGGTIVVGSSGNSRAFIWTAREGMMDLRTYVASLGARVADWQFTEAFSISSDGTAITGQGIYQGQSAGYLITGLPPECAADLGDSSSSPIPTEPDGAVTIDDLLIFLGSFDGSNLRADMDNGSSRGIPDGSVTIDDLLFFLAHFEAGC